MTTPEKQSRTLRNGPTPLKPIGNVNRAIQEVLAQIGSLAGARPRPGEDTASDVARKAFEASKLLRDELIARGFVPPFSEENSEKKPPPLPGRSLE